MLPGSGSASGEGVGGQGLHTEAKSQRAAGMGRALGHNPGLSWDRGPGERTEGAQDPGRYGQILLTLNVRRDQAARDSKFPPTFIKHPMTVG